MEMTAMMDMAQGASGLMGGGSSDDQDNKSQEQAGNMLMKGAQMVAENPELAAAALA